MDLWETGSKDVRRREMAQDHIQ